MSTSAEVGHPPAARRTASIVMLLILSLALRPGIVSIGPILLKIRQAFNLSYSQASLLTSIPDICMGFFVLFVPALSRRLGIQRTVWLSLILLGTATLMRALAQSTALLLLWTTFVGVGIAIAGALIGGWIKENFANNSSLFMGVYAGGLSIGATMAAGGSGYISEMFASWRFGAGVWTVLAFTGIASWFWLTRQAHRANASSPTAAPRTAIVLPWRSGRAWFIAVFFGLSQFIAYSCLAWVAPSFSEITKSSLPSGAMLAVFTFLLAVGSFTAGFVSKKSTDRRVWLAAGMLATAVGFVGLTFFPALFPIVPIALIAFGQGMCFALGMMLPLDYSKSGQAHAWSMFVLCIGYMIAALGPFSVGLLRDWSGGFFDSYLMLLILSFVMIAMIPAFKARQH